MSSLNEEFSIEIINDFRRVGYSYLRLPRELILEAHSLATFLYDLDVLDRLSGLATTKSGVLGYYPSEQEAKEIARVSGTNISTWAGVQSRGYSSYDFMEEQSSILGTSPVIKENAWIDSVPAFRERALSLYGHFKVLVSKLSCNLSSALSSTAEAGGTDLHDYFQRDCLSLMRILNYRADETAQVSKEHTDYEFVTLSLSTGEGLEVKSPAGHWEIVSQREDHAVLLPGDMFEVVSRGYVRSSLHRARCGGNARKAVIFFQGLPLEFKINYTRLGDMAPRSFGEHIVSLLLRGSAHLAPHAEHLAKQMNIAMPLRNPFRLGK